MENQSGAKGFTAAITAFVIGIIAVIAAAIYGLVTRVSPLVLICEGVVLASLIVLLVICLKAKSKISAQLLKEEISPYASVNKNEIYKLFDMIEDAKDRRDKSNAFAAAGAVAATADILASDDGKEKTDEAKSADDSKSDNGQAKTDADDSSLKPVDKKADEETKSSDKKDKKEKKEKKLFGRRATDKTDQPGTESADNPDDTRKDDKTMGEYDYDGRGGRRRTDADPNARARDPYARRRQGYDPYYDDVYYNEYGEPVRRRRPPAAYDPYYGGDVYYNEYGEPVRRRPAQDPYARGDVYYNEYGEPVRRRRPPQDPYARQGQPPRRRPAGEGQPQRRRPAPDQAAERKPAPEAAAPADTAAQTDAENTAAAAQAVPEAPVNTAPARPDNYYEDDYVPIVLPDDDPVDDDYYAHSTKRSAAGVARSDRDEGRAPARRSAAGVRYDDRPPVPASRYEDEMDDYEPVPVVVPVFEDEDDYAPRSNYDDRRDYDNAPDSRRGAPANYDDEDDYVRIAIPVEEGDDPVQTEKDIPRMPVPKKNISKVKIGKIRRKKITRNSRKYKKFRASVHSLDDYLHNFSLKAKK
ncbi:MAG: hypothetical protein IJP10_05185 [Clostridia bacterium]|nr:hypothetical protein [Clostridia bacterium]